MNATLTDRHPAYATTLPFDQPTALANLRMLGQELHHQAIAGATTEELDETLSAMGQVHNRIVSALGDALRFPTDRSQPRRTARGNALRAA